MYKAPIRNINLYEQTGNPFEDPYRVKMPWLDNYHPYIPKVPIIDMPEIEAPSKEPDWPFDGLNCYSSANGDLNCEGKTGHIYVIPCGTWPAADCQDGSEGIPWGTNPPIDESIQNYNLFEDVDVPYEDIPWYQWPLWLTPIGKWGRGHRINYYWSEIAAWYDECQAGDAAACALIERMLEALRNEGVDVDDCDYLPCDDGSDDGSDDGDPPSKDDKEFPDEIPPSSEQGPMWPILA
jgi:hypothetical protein